MLDAMALDYYQRARRQPTLDMFDTKVSQPIEEHSVVTLAELFPADGKILPAGARGTVVAVYKGGRA